MSLVKWCPTQHAFPRSAIFTEMTSQATSSAIFSGNVGLLELLFDLSRLIPEMSLVNRSLNYMSATRMAFMSKGAYAVFSLCFWTSSSFAGLMPSLSAIERPDGVGDETARTQLITRPPL